MIQKDIYTEDNIKCNGFRANVRDTDNTILGIVTDKYRIVQNTQAFEFTDNLLGEGVRYETAGSLANGKRIWLLAKMETANITDEKIDPFLVFSNSHDGSNAVRIAITPIRVVCQNTLNLAMQKASRSWSAMHTGNIDVKLQEAKETLINAHLYMDNLEKELTLLKRAKIDDNKLRELVDDLIPIKENDNIGKIQSQKSEIIYRYYNAPDLKDREESLFRFVNAVSDYATHTEPQRRTANWKENMFFRTVDGNKLIDRAYNMSKIIAA